MNLENLDQMNEDEIYSLYYDNIIESGEFTALYIYLACQGSGWCGWGCECSITRSRFQQLSEFSCAHYVCKTVTGTHECTCYYCLTYSGGFQCRYAMRSTSTMSR